MLDDAAGKSLGEFLRNPHSIIVDKQCALNVKDCGMMFRSEEGR